MFTLDSMLGSGTKSSGGGTCGISGTTLAVPSCARWRVLKVSASMASVMSVGSSGSKSSLSGSKSSLSGMKQDKIVWMKDLAVSSKADMGE